MKYIFGLLLLYSIFPGCKETEIESNLVALEPTVIQQIDSIGQAFLDGGGVQGIAIAVAKQGSIVYHGEFGSMDSSGTMPVTEKTCFLLASISKLMTATMIMKLVDEQKISLDQPLAELLPDYPDSAHAKIITLRHLLTHTAGLKDYATVIDTVYIETGIAPVKDDFYRFFKTHALDFEPGTNFSYSNSGFLLAAMIIDQVTGNTLRDEVNRIINAPSGLDFKWISDRISGDHFSALFEVQDTSVVCVPHWPWIKGDGGLTATPQDLALFPFYWSDGTIISETSFDEMCTSATLDDGIQTQYGVGVRTGKFEGEYCIGHTGGNRTTKAVMKYYPHLRTSVVVMVNTDNSPADAQYIEGFVSLAVLQKPEPDLQSIAITRFDSAQYIGVYTSAPNMYYGSGDFELLTYPDDMHLYRRPVGSTSRGQKLYYLGDHAFAYEDYPMDRIVFETDSSGSVVAFNPYWNGLRKGRLWKKVKQ